MTDEKSNLGNNLSYLLIGGGIGAILALLFAPKTREELRSNIADATRNGMNKTEELASQLSETAQIVYADTKTKAGEIYDSAKQKLNLVATELTEIPANLQNAVHDKVEQISSSIEAGQKEYDRENGVLSLKAARKQTN